MPSALTLAVDVGAFALVALLVVVVSRRAEVSASVRRRLSGEAKPARESPQADNNPRPSERCSQSGARLGAEDHPPGSR